MAKYQRQSKIASGGFGCVYRAKRIEDDQIVAFKVLEGPDITNEDRIRFTREVRIQLQLDHPHIVPILGSNLTANPPFFIMPLATGNLRIRLCEGSFLGNLKTVLNVFMQLLDGCAFAHANGVIHRDLKPENVLFFNEDIFGDEVFRISDFGLGKRMNMESLTITRSDIGMGTAAYMPPEQYMDFKRADHHADIYALGKMLYELLTGELPLHVNTYNTKLPRGFGYVIRKCIEHNPVDRYSSVLDLKKEILELTTEKNKFEHPDKEIEKLIIALKNDHRNTNDLIDKIDRLFLNNSDDEAFYTKYFVKLESIGIKQYLSFSKEKFIERIDVFDSFLGGNLPWSYTDIVADFYKIIWAQTEDSHIRKIILQRLLEMGHSHNRWHVAGVFCGLIKEVADEEEGLMVRDVLRGNPSAAKWMKSFYEGSFLPVIKDGFPEETK